MSEAAPPPADGQPPADGLPPDGEAPPPPPPPKPKVPRGPLIPPQFARVLIIGAVLASIASLGCWLAALRLSFPEPQPGLLVVVDKALVAQAPVDVRVLAVAPRERRRAPFTGSVRIADQVAVVTDDIARIALTPKHGFGQLTVDGAVEGVPVRLDIPLQIVDGVTLPLEDVAGSRPWSDELLLPTPQQLELPPVYPVHGRASSRHPSTLLVLEQGNNLTKKEVQGAADGVVLDDGRRLRVDRSGLRIVLPSRVFVGGPMDVEVHSVDEGALTIDLLVDGRVRGLTSAAIEDGVARTRLRIPFDAPERSIVVVRASTSPWPNTEGRVAIVRVASLGESRAQRVAALEKILVDASLVDDPLMACTKVGACGTNEAELDEIERALLQRLTPRRAGADVASPPLEEQIVDAQQVAVAHVGQWRLPFRVGGAVVFLLLVLAVLVGNQGPRVPGIDRPSIGAGLLAAFGAMALAGALDWVLDLVGRTAHVGLTG